MLLFVEAYHFFAKFFLLPQPQRNRKTDNNCGKKENVYVFYSSYLAIFNYCFMLATHACFWYSVTWKSVKVNQMKI